MKKILQLLSGFLIVGSFILIPALPASADLDLISNESCSRAEGVGSKPTACRDDNPSNDRLFGDKGIFGIAIQIISIVIGIAAVLVIIIAGIQYMLSTGDPTRTNNAKNALIYAIVGIIVALLAQVAVRLMGSRLG